MKEGKAVWKSQTGVHLGKCPILRRILFCRRCNFKNINCTSDNVHHKFHMTWPRIKSRQLRCEAGD
jgi:hypothetical protein